MNRFCKFAMSLACLLVLAMSAGCGNPMEKQEIAIGTNLELSGAGQSYSEPTQRGVELAIDEINENGGLLGKKVTLISLDNHSDGSDSLRNMKMLASQKVRVIIGPNLSPDALAVTNFAEEVKIPVISPAGSYPGVTTNMKNHEAYSYMFRATFIDPVQGRAMARFANRTLKARTAAVVYDPSSVYSSGLATFFREAFGTENGNVTAYIAYNSSLDLETVLQTLQKSQADVIYLPMYHWQALPLVRQMRAETIAVPILGCDGWDNGQFAQLAEAEKLMPLYFTNHYSMDPKEAEDQAFIEAYTKKFGVAPDIYAALGYDAAMMAAEAIKRAGSTDGTRIAQELERTMKFAGITGEISLDANHDAVKDVYILSFQDGGSQFVAKLPGM